MERKKSRIRNVFIASIGTALLILVVVALHKFNLSSVLSISYYFNDTIANQLLYLQLIFLGGNITFYYVINLMYKASEKYQLIIQKSSKFLYCIFQIMSGYVFVIVTYFVIYLKYFM